MKYITVVLTLILVTYGQLILKYEMSRMGPIPTGGIVPMLVYFARALTNIGVLSGLAAAFLAALAWMAAMSTFPLSAIYPILSLNFVIVPLLSVLIFGETVNAYNIGGVAIIVLGVIVFSRGL